jgi:hypothetical protein
MMCESVSAKLTCFPVPLFFQALYAKTSTHSVSIDFFLFLSLPNLSLQMIILMTNVSMSSIVYT